MLRILVQRIFRLCTCILLVESKYDAKNAIFWWSAFSCANEPRIVGDGKSEPKTFGRLSLLPDQWPVLVYIFGECIFESVFGIYKLRSPPAHIHTHGVVMPGSFCLHNLKPVEILWMRNFQPWTPNYILIMCCFSHGALFFRSVWPGIIAQSTVANTKLFLCRFNWIGMLNNKAETKRIANMCLIMLDNFCICRKLFELCSFHAMRLLGIPSNFHVFMGFLLSQFFIWQTTKDTPEKQHTYTTGGAGSIHDNTPENWMKKCRNKWKMCTLSAVRISLNLSYHLHVLLMLTVWACVSSVLNSLNQIKKQERTSE